MFVKADLAIGSAAYKMYWFLLELFTELDPDRDGILMLSKFLEPLKEANEPKVKLNYVNKEDNSDLKTSVVQKLGEIFKMGKTEVKPFQYVSFQFDQKVNGIIVSQNDFAKKVTFLDIEPDCAQEVEDDLKVEERFY